MSNEPTKQDPDDIFETKFELLGDKLSEREKLAFQRYFSTKQALNKSQAEARYLHRLMNQTDFRLAVMQAAARLVASGDSEEEALAIAMRLFDKAAP